MVRLRGRDDLSDTKGQLGADFRSVNLATLHVHFFTAAITVEKKEAARALHTFYRAANKLCTRELEFNRRARPVSSTPSLMSHLRGSAHLAALREFSSAKEGLMSVNPVVGGRIIRLIEKDIDASARASAHSALTPAFM